MKQAHLLTLLATSALYCLTGNAQSTLTDGLVAFYPFNGNAEDASGNKQNGTVNGAVLAPDRFGNPNRAYHFNGTNNYIQVPESTAFDSGDYSVSIWFNTERFPITNLNSRQADFLISKGQGNFEIHLGARLGQSDATASGIRLLPRNPTGNWDTGPSVYSLNTWTHLIAVYQPSAQSVKMYINGTEVPVRGTTTPISKPDNLTPARIGMRTDGTLPFQGSLDELRIYNRALTPGEASQLYQIESGGTPFLDIEVASVRLKWLTRSDDVYQLQWASALQDWTNMVTIVGNGATTNLIDVVDGERRFYKLVRVGSLTDGLVAHYPLNGNAMDTSGSNNGSIQNAVATTNRFGDAISALAFNGTSSFVDFASLPLTNLDNFTLAAWISPSKLPQQSYAVLLGYAVEDPSLSTGVGMGVSSGDGLVGNGFTGTISGIQHLPTGYTFSSTNEWHHVAMTRTGGTIKFYVDGAQTSSISILQPKLPTAFRIGASHNPGVAVFDGAIDDVRIYKRALNEEELEALISVP